MPPIIITPMTPPPSAAERDWLPIVVLTAAAFGLAGALLHVLGRLA